MLAKCANPDCHAPFHYLRDGRLFQIEFGSQPRPGTDKRPPYRVEYFWLCARCAASMTLKYETGKGVTAVPLRTVKRAAGW